MWQTTLSIADLQNTYCKIQQLFTSESFDEGRQKRYKLGPCAQLRRNPPANVTPARAHLGDLRPYTSYEQWPEQWMQAGKRTQPGSHYQSKNHLTTWTSRMRKRSLSCCWTQDATSASHKLGQVRTYRRYPNTKDVALGVFVLPVLRAWD